MTSEEQRRYDPAKDPDTEPPQTAELDPEKLRREHEEPGSDPDAGPSVTGEEVERDDDAP